MQDIILNIKIKPMDKKISIIHPSRSRGNQAFQTYQKWINKSKNPNNIEYILSLDDNDPMLELYNFLFKSIPITIITNNNRSAIDAINKAAQISTKEILIQIAEDFDCPQDWDEILLNNLKDKEDFIVKTNDGTQDWIITLPIMDRKYFNRFGYIYYPEYLHMFSDTELSHVADFLERKIYLDIYFPHNHYTTGKNIRDEVSIKADSTWNQGETLYLGRLKNNFNLENITGKLKCGPSHISWLKNKGILI